MPKTIVAVRGFQAGELQEWPADLAPVVSTQLPGAGFLVVHARAASEFQDEVLAGGAAGRDLPAAVLYLPSDEAEPPDAWLFYDDMVREQDWVALRHALACPERSRTVELADELPGAFLAGLGQPIEKLPIPQLPLPQAMRDHLMVCDACRTAFYTAVDTRLRWQRLLCPSPADLAAHAAGNPSLHISRHLATCRSCQAEVIGLQHQAASARVQVSLVPLGKDLLATIAGLPSQWAEAVGMLINSCLASGLVPAGARTRRRSPSGKRATPTLSHLLSEMRHGEPLLLTWTDQELLFVWDEAKESLHVELVHRGNEPPVKALRATLFQGGEVLWTTPRTEEPSADIPLAALQRALERGAGTLEFASR